jgi:transposase-like protein
MARDLDEMVTAFRDRPLDGGPYTYVWIDALTQRVREAGRIQSVAALVATGVNAAGYREILGLDLVASEDGAGWTAFLRGLVRVTVCRSTRTRRGCSPNVARRRLAGRAICPLRARPS